MYKASVPNISTCTDVVGCNEQVLVPTSSQLELPYTYTLAERYTFNMSFIQKAALFYSRFNLLASPNYNLPLYMSFPWWSLLFTRMGRCSRFQCLLVVFEVQDFV